jgi:predicted RNA binding protein YcfA (HicA-like mRNA interferase family)
VVFDSILLTAYSYIVGKTDKLLEKARVNPGGLTFAEFETLLASLGWCFDRQSGSHRIWISPRGERLSIQSRQGEAKAYQVKQLLRIHNDDTHEKD